MKHQNRLTEANKMRKLMGLDFIAESKEAIAEIEKAQKMAEARALKEKELKAEGHYIDEDAPEKDSGVVMGAEWQADDKLDKTNIDEDSEGEETYHYGSDEGYDEERIDHDDLSGGHIEALKKDMAYDEDHEDRRERGTDFWEQKTFKIKKGGKVINITESDIKKLSKLLKEDDDWMQGAEEDIEKRGTEGVFHKFCVDHGFEDGCSEGCWDKAKEKGGVWGRRAGLAKAFCESKH